jgi:predicted NUDIX family NTP pyrophosphohydrolase
MVQSMPKDSAGVLLFRGDAPDGLEVLLAHPGGPVWAKKDDQGWTIPKGEPSPGEDLLVAAKREFEEEMGSAPSGEFLALGSILQPSGRKVVHVWAARSDFDVASLKSNLFSMEWPPRSGRTQQFVEVDRAQWFPMAVARRKIWPGQVPFLDRLIDAVAKSRT